jgi:hypothetical protein
LQHGPTLPRIPLEDLLPRTQGLGYARSVEDLDYLPQ